MPDNAKPDSSQTEKTQQPDGSPASPNSGSPTKITMTRTPAQRRWRQAGIALGTTVCLLSLTAGTVFGHFYWGSTTFRTMVTEHGFQALVDVATTGDVTKQWTPERQFSDRTSMNVLVLGVDHDYDNRDRIIKSSPGRSDSILLARVDFVHNTISALTIPRDTAVHIPGYRGIHKINAAHNLGSEELTMETIKSVFGVQPDACVTINLEGFQEVVNAIGGIDVNVEKKLDYDDNWGNLHIHLKPGYQHMDGYKAMGYVRMRHSDSDEMRSKRQHEFLEAVRTKMKSWQGFQALPTLVDKLSDNLKLANLTRDQMYALANFARHMPKDNITIKTLPSFEGPSYVTIHAEKSAELIQQMFFPNDQVALNIDAPDPNTINAMNAPYERGGRGRRGKGAKRERTTSVGTGEITGPAPAIDGPPAETPPDSGEGKSTDTPAHTGDAPTPGGGGDKTTPDKSGGDTRG